MRINKYNQRAFFLGGMVLVLGLFFCLGWSGCKKQEEPALKAPPPGEAPPAFDWRVTRPDEPARAVPRPRVEPNRPAEEFNRAVDEIEQLVTEFNMLQAEGRRRIYDPNAIRMEPNEPTLKDVIAAIEAVPEVLEWPHPRTSERMSERRLMAQVIRDLYGLTDPEVLAAMENVPRHWFVIPSEQTRAYADMPLPIGQGQTISQPYMVAYMTDVLELSPDKKVLEVGTGSGYQAAVLTEFTPYVYTIEIVESLGRATADQLRRRGYQTIESKIGDGYLGWEEKGPFDAIIVTCAADHIPPSLIEQLKPGGKMCIPVGQPLGIQNLMLIDKDLDGKVTDKSLIPVTFVPLIRK